MVQRAALLLLLAIGGCRTPPLSASLNDLATIDLPPPAADFALAFDFALPDLPPQLGDLDGEHGCQGYSRCVDSCENDPNCTLRCNRSATARAVYLFNAAVACGPAYCRQPRAGAAPRCDGQADPPGTPSGTCVRCEKDAVANLLERVCLIDSPDCNAAACLPAISACIKDGS